MLFTKAFHLEVLPNLRVQEFHCEKTHHRLIKAIHPAGAVSEVAPVLLGAAEDNEL